MTKSHLFCRAFVVPALLLCSTFAAADVTVQETLKSGGLRGIGAYQATETRQVSGLKAREDQAKRFTGAVLKFFSGKKGKEAVTIERVDLDKRWTLDPKHKTYRETPISMPPAKGEPRQARSQPGSSGGGSSRSTTVIKKTEFSVKDTGQTKTFGDFTARKYAITYRLETEDTRSGQTSDYRMLADYWTTPWTSDLRKADAEQESFAKAYAAKEGFGVVGDPRTFGLSMLAMMTAAGHKDVAKAQTDFRDKIATIKGFPVVVDTRWYASSSNSGSQASQASSSGDDLSAGNAQEAVAGFLGGLARKAIAHKMDSGSGPDGLGKPVFSARVEVTSVSVAGVPTGRFEIPAGYKKKG